MTSPHRRRLQHFNEEGHAHFITFSCWQRRSLLSIEHHRSSFIVTLNKALTKHDFGCWAYVIMPEHVHLVVVPHTALHSVGAFLSSVKLGTTRLVIEHPKRTNSPLLNQLLDTQTSGKKIYRFWQPGGGIDFNLWSAEKIWEKIGYCHKNPVRRKLVIQPEEWPWSSCRDFVAAKTVGQITIDWKTLPKDPLQDPERFNGPASHS